MVGWSVSLLFGRRCVFAECFEQAVEKRLLALEDAGAGFRNGIPRSTIDFRDADLAAGARRPLDLTLVADQLCSVEVAGAGPGGDELAGGLADAAEIEEVAGDREAGF